MVTRWNIFTSASSSSLRIHVLLCQQNICIESLVNVGTYKYSFSSETVNTAYIISRRDLSRLVSFVANALLYKIISGPKLLSISAAGFFKLPYRVIFALATLNSLYIYDTESLPPIAIFAGLHYAAITDIAWLVSFKFPYQTTLFARSSDAKYLSLSSRDGYCTIIEFEDYELGEAISPSDHMEIDKKNAAKVNSETVTEIKERRLPISTGTKNSDANKSTKKRITPTAIN
ncbi:hypothetical protein BHE74_00049102 [Ensete ventricosum]|nr:hypothetical protein BHE74_00049102 [Ensete ventricosum]